MTTVNASSRHGDSWHEGELALQRQAGIRDSQRLRAAIHRTIPSAAKDFLADQRLAVLATIDGEQRPWASLLTGPPGFLHARGDAQLQIDVGEGLDPLAQAHLSTHPMVGLLVLEPATRRRMRLNGSASRTTDGQLRISADEVYSNCPQYIRRRAPSAESETPSSPSRVWQSKTLSASQQRRIAAADTFFLATMHPRAGADASHRGGEPGFVRATATTLSFPDYRGNFLFQSLGNILETGRAGLIFADFTEGRTLQLTGSARIDEAPASLDAFPGAERVVHVEIEAVVDRNGAFRHRWTPLDKGSGGE